MTKNQKTKPHRKKGHWILQNFLKIFIRKPKFIYLDGDIKEPAIILSNHKGKTVPLALDLYFKTPFRFWGTHQMNDGLKSVYKFLTEDYYPKKMHWNPFWAKVFCFTLAAPLVNLYYKGLNLISTYEDARFKTTLKQSMQAIKDGHSIVIFPEDSATGYYDEMTKFFAGFILLAKKCYKKGQDIPLYVAYLQNKPKKYIISEPIYYSQIKDMDRDEAAKMLCQKTNSFKNFKTNNNQ